MDHKINHPVITTATILSVLGLCATGVGAYATVKEDISALQQGQEASEERNQERYQNIREDLRDVKDLLNDLLLKDKE